MARSQKGAKIQASKPKMRHRRIFTMLSFMTFHHLHLVAPKSVVSKWTFASISTDEITTVVFFSAKCLACSRFAFVVIFVARGALVPGAQAVANKRFT